MLCGDVPWEGSSRRSVSLRAVGERQGSLSLRVSFLERNLADGVGALPHACGGSAPRGWIEPQWLGGGGARAPDKSSVENS